MFQNILDGYILSKITPDSYSPALAAGLDRMVPAVPAASVEARQRGRNRYGIDSDWFKMVDG